MYFNNHLGCKYFLHARFIKKEYDRFMALKFLFIKQTLFLYNYFVCNLFIFINLKVVNYYAN
jgi:hypothetical protein